MNKTIVAQATTTSQETKEAINNVILMGQVFHDAIINLPQEIQYDMHKEVLEFQRKLVSLLPIQTQQWVMKELQKNKIKILSAALKNHINTAEGPHELIYKETQKLLDYLSFNRRRTKKLNSEKYTAVFKYLKQELEADITGGTPGMMVHEGSIVFQLVNPTPKYKNESTD